MWSNVLHFLYFSFQYELYNSGGVSALANCETWQNNSIHLSQIWLKNEPKKKKKKKVER